MTIIPEIYFLTGSGIEQVEKYFGIQNLHDKANFELLTAVNLAIHARELLHRGVGLCD